LLQDGAFVRGDHTTRTVEGGGVLDGLVQEPDDDEVADVLMVEGRAVRLWNPAMSASASAAVHGGHAGGDVVAPMQGTILKVLVEEGAPVTRGTGLVILEAMKMETTISASSDGTVSQLRVAPGDPVRSGEVLVVIE
jgi:biotin carboxyl carrier protein